ncbi:hypothetical protein Tco_0810266 [Tanacetum coccineum]
MCGLSSSSKRHIQESGDDLQESGHGYSSMNVIEIFIFEINAAVSLLTETLRQSRDGWGSSSDWQEAELQADEKDATRRFKAIVNRNVGVRQRPWENGHWDTISQQRYKSLVRLDTGISSLTYQPHIAFDDIEQRLSYGVHNNFTKDPSIFMLTKKCSFHESRPLEASCSLRFINVGKEWLQLRISISDNLRKFEEVAEIPTL